VQQLVEVFGEDARPPKVVDRRGIPVHGYRAVHLIVLPTGRPVEIQVRTLWQQEWAELFEKLADRVGRGIRYGEAPVRWWTTAEFDAMDGVEQAVQLFNHTGRGVAVDIALSVAAMIDAVETRDATAPEDPELDAYRQQVDECSPGCRRVSRIAR
jgi:hypothetical protein